MYKSSIILLQLLLLWRSDILLKVTLFVIIKLRIIKKLR